MPPPAEGGSRLTYLPGLDGFRALAVIAVLLYHSDLPWMRGGFLGVEVFFVISGYLITSLLLAEWQERGHIDLPGFWLRRARRLLPALYTLLAVTLSMAVLFLPREVAGLRADAAGAAGYVTNWYLLFSHKPYFQVVGRPSLLRHLWSLAVEEQFYLLWPPLLALGLRLLRRRRMARAVLAGAAASAALMALLYRPDADPSRVYYGTDTRSAGLLLGAALAFIRVPAGTGGRLGRVLGLGALGGLGVLGWCCLRLDEYQPFLYRGGFAVVALATAAVIAALAGSRAWLGARLLGSRPLRWVGLRSYSIYLWHWPVFVLTRPQLDLALDGLPLLALRLGVTGLLAEASYRYVEAPIRGGALGRAWRSWRQASGSRRRRLVAWWSAAAGTVVAFSVLLGVSVAAAQPAVAPSYLAVEEVHIVAGEADVAPVAPADPPTAAPTPTRLPLAALPIPRTGCRPSLGAALATSPGRPATPVPRPAWLPTLVPTRTPAPTPAPTRTLGVHISAVGDSVMLGAVGPLQRALGDVDVDAAVSRQVYAAIKLLRERHDAGQLGPVVVLHLGNNGGFTARQFDELMRVLADTPLVVFVNLKVPRSWEGPNNAVLAEGVRRYPNATLVDWHAAAVERPEYFWDDGIHLRPEGARAYADLIATHLKDTPGLPPATAAPDP